MSFSGCWARRKNRGHVADNASRRRLFTAMLGIPAKVNAYSGWNPNGIPG